MSKRQYSFRPGSRVSGVSADVAGAELDRIHAARGELTPGVLVDESREPAAPLHPAFEWDDSVAGEEWRKQQARHIIRAVHVQYEPATRAAPAFFHIRAADKPRYEPVAVVAQSPDLFAAALEVLQEKIAGAMRAVDDLRAAARQFGQTDRAEKIDLVSRALGAASEAALGL